MCKLKSESNFLRIVSPAPPSKGHCLVILRLHDLRFEHQHHVLKKVQLIVLRFYIEIRAVNIHRTCWTSTERRIGKYYIYKGGWLFLQRILTNNRTRSVPTPCKYRFMEASVTTNGVLSTPCSALLRKKSRFSLLADCSFM